MEICGIKLEGENRSTWRKTFPSATFFYHKSHMDWPEIKSSSSLSEDGN